jgi:hypothetical protein
MVMRAGVALFMLVGHHRHDKLARNLIQTLPLIMRFLEQHKPPFIAKVLKAQTEEFESGKPGRVEMWLTFDQWNAHQKSK